MSIRAVLFDLDGTLVDSEGNTDSVIGQVMERHGHPGILLPPNETRGRSWPDIAAHLRSRYRLPTTPEALVDELSQSWGETIEGVAPIPGSIGAVKEVSSLFKVAVVSSSPRALIDRVLEHIKLSSFVPSDARVGADQVVQPKPSPEGYLLAAERVGARPEECVVFEDSRAGLEAARAARMASVLVLYRCGEIERCRGLATGCCLHYQKLPSGFWERLRTEGASLLRDAWL